MAAPLIEFAEVVKQLPGREPLRISALAVNEGEGFVLAGLDAVAAELFVHLVTGASVPDAGDVRIAGRSTREIATDTEWLASLDRFGIVTERAVLLESMPLAANLALPFTLAIDPLADDVRVRVAGLADEVGLRVDRLDSPAQGLSPEERIRAHLARALAPGPRVLILEHPTARLEAGAAGAIGAAVKSVATRRGLGWVALTEDDPFARASGGRRLRLEPTGRLRPNRRWRWPLS